MSQLTLVLIAAPSISIVFVLFLIWHSREGHEDEKGFHLGAEDEQPAPETVESAPIELRQQQPAPDATGLPIAAKR